MSESKYGEPWSLDGTRIIASKNGVEFSITAAVLDTWRNRAIACVNALAGKDPSKLDELLRLTEGFLRATEEWNASMESIIGRQPQTGIPITKLREVLAAFTGEMT